MYFSTAPLPNDVDTTQLDALRAFKKDMQDRGLLGEFSSVEQLNHEVWKAIEHDISAVSLPQATGAAPSPVGVDFLVQPRQEREVSGFSSKGAPRYSTKHWAEITNTGDRDAESVTFESPTENGGMFVGGDDPTTIHRGQMRRVPLMFTWGGSTDPILRIHWVEDGENHQRDFHVG